MEITINGLEFADSAHTGFVFQELKDWYTLPDSKSSGESRPRAHGRFSAGFDWRDAAVPSLSGIYLGDSEAAALSAMNDLKRALAVGTQVSFDVADELGTTSRTVSIRSVSIPDHHKRRQFSYQIVTLAADPLRYGAEITSSTGVPVAGGGLTWPITWPVTWLAGGSSGRLTIVNNGTAETFPEFYVTGELSGGFSITQVGTGNEIRLERFVPAGSTVKVDQRTGRVTIDGDNNDVSGSLTRWDWFSVAPGQTTTVQFNAIGTASGSPTLTHRTRPAFW